MDSAVRRADKKGKVVIAFRLAQNRQHFNGTHVHGLARHNVAVGALQRLYALPGGLQRALDALGVVMQVHRHLRRNHAHKRHVVQMKVRDEDSGVQLAFFRAFQRVIPQVLPAVDALDARKDAQPQLIAHPVFIPGPDGAVKHVGGRVVRQAAFKNHAVISVGDGHVDAANGVKA